MHHTDRYFYTYLLIVLFFSFMVPQKADTQANTFYVAENGSDNSGDGTESNPWASLQHAIDSVNAGSTILVKPGTYTDVTRLNRHFNPGIIIRSETPYRARLRANETVIKSFGGSGYTIEGFDISHSGSSASALIIQIGDSNAFDIHFKNNILHDSFNNDILKINNGSHDVTVVGNIFYNQQGSDEHIDVNSVKNVEIYENVFFNDFAASGRVNNNDTSSFIVIKDSNGNSDGVLGSENITVGRNVFLNYQGSTGSGFIFVGEDGTKNFEAINVLIENNLMIGNSLNRMKTPLGVHGSNNITFRSNTVTGDLVAQTFAIRSLQLGSNMPSDNIFLYNNIWSDPTGTMGISGPSDTTTDFSDTPLGELLFFVIDNNLYWNGSEAIPEDLDETINYTNDNSRTVGDPELGIQNNLITPVWNQNNGVFTDGSLTIRDVFENLVNLYGIPGKMSMAIDNADPLNVPAEDILGNSRIGELPDIGAVETGGNTQAPQPMPGPFTPGEQPGTEGGDDSEQGGNENASPNAEQGSSEKSQTGCALSGSGLPKGIPLHHVIPLIVIISIMRRKLHKR